MSALLQVSGLAVGPPGAAPLAGPADLAVDAGGATALRGPSGAGKTLLLRGLVGLAPAAWTRAVLGGEDLGALPPRVRRRRLVYVHQEVWRFAGTVRADLERVRGLFAGDEPWERAVAWLERAGLGSAVLERETGSLSVGEMRRVALVRALQVAPRVLLLDEPTAGLDEESARLVAELLRAWRTEAPGRGALVATHDTALAAECTRSVELAPHGARAAAGETEGPP